MLEIALCLRVSEWFSRGRDDDRQFGFVLWNQPNAVNAISVGGPIDASICGTKATCFAMM
jgi:hypothetical protein